MIRFHCLRENFCGIQYSKHMDGEYSLFFLLSQKKTIKNTKGKNVSPSTFQLSYTVGGSSKPISSNDEDANLLIHKYILYFPFLFSVLGNGQKMYFYGGIFSAEWNWCCTELVYLCDLT